MKKLSTITSAIWAICLFASCTLAIYTHQQVMQSFRTRTAVQRQFGIPDETMEDNGKTVWRYNCDSTSKLVQWATVVKRNGVFSPAADTAGMRSEKVSKFTDYRKYAEFSFDTQGNVIAYNSRGVNFAEKRPDAAKTTLLIIGFVALVVAVMSMGSHTGYGWY